VAKYYDQTDIGGAGGVFLTTHWSLIEDIKLKEDKDRALIGLLLQRYWKPVYCYLRRKGYDNEQAKDLTQDFFNEVVLNRNLVKRADQCKGRFRTFLLHALNQYLINVRNAENVAKHIPADKLVSLEIIDPVGVSGAISKLSPEDSYNYAWLSSLLDQILSEVQRQCYEDGMEIHWKIFHDHVVKSILENAEPYSLVQICEKYGIEDQKKASNMNITVKRRFQSTLKRYIRDTVTSENQVDEELEEIMRFFSERGAAF
jgi:RNA polymerase sigma-70 factor (ECF subfamily)